MNVIQVWLRDHPYYKISGFMDPLNVPYPRLYQMMRGAVAFTPAQAQTMATIMGRAVEEVFEERNYIAFRQPRTGLFPRPAADEAVPA